MFSFLQVLPLLSPIQTAKDERGGFLSSLGLVFGGVENKKEQDRWNQRDSHWQIHMTGVWTLLSTFLGRCVRWRLITSSATHCVGNLRKDVTTPAARLKISQQRMHLCHLVLFQIVVRAGRFPAVEHSPRGNRWRAVFRKGNRDGVRAVGCNDVGVV